MASMKDFGQAHREAVENYWRSKASDDEIRAQLARFARQQANISKSICRLLEIWAERD